MTDIVQIQESEYDAILRQAVAVIDRTRAMVATTVCSAIGTAHWEIGKLLHDKKLESKHGSGVVNRLSYDFSSVRKFSRGRSIGSFIWNVSFCSGNPTLRTF